LRVAAVTLDVGLAVDVAAIAAHRRVTYPPPARNHHGGLVAVGHGQNPLLVSFGVPATSYVSALVVSSGLTFEILFEIPQPGKCRRKKLQGETHGPPRGQICRDHRSRQWHWTRGVAAVHERRRKADRGGQNRSRQGDRKARGGCRRHRGSGHGG